MMSVARWFSLGVRVGTLCFVGDGSILVFLYTESSSFHLGTGRTAVLLADLFFSFGFEFDKIFSIISLLYQLGQIVTSLFHVYGDFCFWC